MKLKIKEAMSSYPVSVKYQDRLSTAYEQMRREGVRHLPVLDEKGELMGIISDRDFQRAMWPDKKRVEAKDLPKDLFPLGFKGTVYDYMTWPVKTLPHTSELMAAVRLMIDEKISAVVITANDEMIGIITHEDLLRVLAALLKEPETLREKALNLAYNSTLGRVSESLAALGF